jgi:hypothetical protein
VGNRTWSVSGQGFAWERLLFKADLKRLCNQPTRQGPLLAVRVAREDKEVLMMEPPEGFFEIERFRGCPAELIKLNDLEPSVLKAAIAEAWRVAGSTGAL